MMTALLLYDAVFIAIRACKYIACARMALAVVELSTVRANRRAAVSWLLNAPVVAPARCCASLMLLQQPYHAHAVQRGGVRRLQCPLPRYVVAMAQLHSDETHSCSQVAFLQLQPYTPPAWAAQLSPIPAYTAGVHADATAAPHWLARRASRRRALAEEGRHERQRPIGQQGARCMWCSTAQRQR